MNLVTKDILKGTSITWRRSLVHFVLAYAGVMLLLNTPMRTYIDTRISWPLDFHARQLLAGSPLVSDKLKIFTVDDSTISWLKRANLQLTEWADLIKRAQAGKPKIIMIDKVFGIEDALPSDFNKQKYAEQNLIRLQAPLVVGAFVTPKPIKYREVLRPDARWTHFSPKFLPPESSALASWFNGSQKAHFSKLGQGAVYGPYSSLSPALKGVGHIMYDGMFTIKPVVQLSSRSYLPYWGTYVANEIRFQGAKLYLDDLWVPTLENGDVIVNMVAYQDLMKKARSLRPIIENSGSNSAISDVKPGDVVVFLPLMYTGNTDFKNSPLGYMPASFVHTSFINSIMTKSVVKPVHATWWLILLLTALATLTTVLLSLKWFGLLALLVPVSTLVGSIGMFTYQQTLIPWLWLGAAYLTPCIFAFAYLFRLNVARSSILRNALEGVVSPQNLNELLANRKNINLEAREYVITVMFIDIVGYSLLAESQVPRIAFDHLKKLLAQISEDVHEFGGIVNKTLGDGLLCFFGYNFGSGEVRTDHAEKAVACAVRIQERNIRANLAAAAANEPVYPLRIGIHTASVFLGDLGAGNRVDFTGVGHGVNFAKRLEQGCEIHSLMFSGTTKGLIGGLNLNTKGLKRRLISIKHHTSQIEVYEFDPFYLDPELRARAIEVYRQCASLARAEQRFTFSVPENIIVNSQISGIRVVNFSIAGINLSFRSHLADGSQLSFELDSVDGRLGKELAKEGIRHIQAEVRWSYNENSTNVHGFVYRNLNEVQAETLVRVLRDFDLSMRYSAASSRSA